MRYFVIGPAGEKYGPADVPLLNQWVREGRLLPGTFLEAEGNPARFPASALSGLHCPNPMQAGLAAGQIPPTAFGSASMPSAWVDPTRSRAVANASWTCSVLSVASSFGLNCLTMPFAAFVYGGVALITAYQARARGNPTGRSAVAVAWLAILLAVARLAADRFGLAWPGL